jgi:hypothetical protein
MALEEDFSEDVGVAPFAPEGEYIEGHFDLFGAELKLHVAIQDQTHDRLWVFSAKPLPSSLLERLREQSYQAPMQFVVAAPQNRARARDDLLQLQVAVAEAAVEKRARERKEEEQRLFRSWRKTLDAKQDLEREGESPIRYERAVVSGPHRLIFDLASEGSEDLIGQARQLELPDGGFVSGDIADVRGTSVVMVVRYGDIHRVPAKAGVLRIDNWPTRVAISRQRAAVDAVQYNRALRPDLGRLLLAPSRCGLPVPVKNIEFIQPGLDDAKKEAIQAALGTPDMMAVEGPPGTGKTTFITELVLQHIQRNPGSRVLLTSQTHAALDNVLERLAELDDSLKLVRVARPDEPRISQGVTRFLIDEQIGSWRAEVVRGGRAYLREWARLRGISERDVEIATLYEELIALSSAVEMLVEEKTAVDAALSSIRVGPTDTTAEQHGAELEERRVRIELDTRRIDQDRREVIDRLVQLGAITHRRELSELTRDELHASLSGIDRSHPAFASCQALIKLLAEWHARFGRGNEFYAATLVRSDVVAATCLGLQAFKGTERVEFDLCIVDEASKATATETLVPLIQAKRWLLVGDQRQLPPFVENALASREVLLEQELSEEEVRESLFDRLISDLPNDAKRLLSLQHRMLPAIGDLISHCFYDGALRSAPADRPEWLAHGFAKPVMWYTTSGLANRFETAAGTSKCNDIEARFIRILLRRINGLARWAGTTVSVAVLSGYIAQQTQIDREIDAERTDWSNLSAVAVSSIDAFQGREAGLLLYSITRSNPENKIGFLHERRRLNVALSRGRLGLILVGDDRSVSLAPEPNPFREIRDYMAAHPDDCAMEPAEL